MAAETECTVVAVFATLSDAESAAEQLKANGFKSSNIHAPTDADVPGSASSHVSPPAKHEGGIRGWFKSLFGGDEHIDLTHYETALAAGNAVVSVDVRDSDIDKASGILSRFSPIDIHTDDFGAAEGVSTSNTNNAGYQGSPSDIYNAMDEIDMAASHSVRTQPGAVTRDPGSAPGTGIRVYKRDR